ncbi:MAG: DEAD/DEAH box helicase [Gammaproteobacteria bacterium]|nr:DEAD/DEAH box helicase [Gammaproteobacteria bacterium]
MVQNITVAISEDFFDAMYNLPKTQQQKAKVFLQKFRSNPMSPGLDYESIKKARVDSLHSVRVDQSYRAIVMKPKEGNVYLLLWIDKHDNAYDWAETRVPTINPGTGAIQILPVEHLQEAESLQPASPDNAAEGLFAAIRDRHLTRIGVPAPLIPLVRKVNDVTEFEPLQAKLPAEAFEALSMICEGESLDDVLSVYDISLQESEEYDTEDFKAALSRPDSMRRFMLMTDDDALNAMLEAPLEKWRVFLHPDQRKLVARHWNGPVRVLGGAGTGKTVVAIHRAKWLADQLSATSEKILFTTFTKNLATDIRQNLQAICSPEQMKRIEVVNLDAMVVTFMRKQGFKIEPLFDESLRNSFWQQAISEGSELPELPDSFYCEEWDEVIQPQSISSFKEYTSAKRLGRGVALTRLHRKQIWPVFEAYRTLLADSGKKEMEDLYRDALNLITSRHLSLNFRHIIVDEAQDFGTNGYKLMRAMVHEGKNDLFIVGDAHQRIYGAKVILGQCGIKITGRGRRLKINYRTTEEIKKYALSVLQGVNIDDLDGGEDSQHGYRSLINGPEPETHCFQTATEEMDYLKDAIFAIDATERGSICVVARTNKLVTNITQELKQRGISTITLGKETSDKIGGSEVRVATMHRVKGLEFSYLFIAKANKGNLPLLFHESEDVTIQRQQINREKSLLYVSITRAKRFCSISGYGELSSLIHGS